MKLILKEDVKNLGQIGEIVNVSDGYARNFLLPKNLAVEANTKNLKEFEHHKNIIMKKAARVRDELKDLSGRLSSASVTIKAKAGEDEKLFGSVTSMDIADALKAEGFDIDKKKISIEEPIKRLGTHAVTIKIHSDISSQVQVHVIQE